MNKIIKKFIETEKTKAMNAGVIFDLARKNKVHYGNIICNGFFESIYTYNEKVVPYLATAIGKPLEQWLPIFIHETCHMDQWIENSPLWLTSNDYIVLDNWLSGISYPEDQIKTFIDKVIMLESDCEKRTIEKIKQFRLPIDTNYYAQRANAYLYFYQWVLKNRKWCKTAPYEIEDIINEMPIIMKENEQYLYPLNEKLMVLFDKCKE